MCWLQGGPDHKAASEELDMHKETITLAILFADIAQSTRYYEVFGDRQAQLFILKCLTRLSYIAHQYHGSVIKTMGDEVMCTFPSADHAIQAGKAMHQRLESMTIVDHDVRETPSIYVGIHIGPVIRDRNDIFGDAVNLAARAVALAKPRQILITEPMYLSLSSRFQSSVRCITKDAIKGKNGLVGVYEYIWDQKDITAVFEPNEVPMPSPGYLLLKYGKKVIKVDAFKSSVSLGRQKHNDLIIPYRRVSRTHAQIEYRRGKFILMDDSLNGTHIRFQDRQEVFIRGDEITLFGGGVISLGRKAAPGSPGAIHFAVRQSC